MMSHLHVLYALDDNYAPFCGTSITSLFENNRCIGEITVHVIGDALSPQNCDKLCALGDLYQRTVILYDAFEIVGKIQQLGMCLYRGSYATNMRLFFADIVKMDIERLLYLDSDTLVVGDLSSLLTFDFCDKTCAAVQESLGHHYKKLIGFSDEDPYYNAGVLLINNVRWRERRVFQRITDYINHVQAKLPNNDQDVINIVLKDEIAVLPAAFNLQPTHQVYNFSEYISVYRPKNYYSEKEILDAVHAPAILHIYRFIGQFPWHADKLHPDIGLFDHYIGISPWSGYQKRKPIRSWVMKVERMLFLSLPKKTFLWVFEKAQYWYFYQLTKKLKQKTE